MRYIKTYERFFSFKVGDLLKVDTLIGDVKNRVYVVETIAPDSVSSRNQYYLHDMKGVKSNDEFSYFWEDEDNLRLATTEEIEEYKIKMDANKYNL